MKRTIALAAFTAIWIGTAGAANQISLPPGSKGELRLRVEPPRAADIIDILVSEPAARLSVLLPNGRELTAENAESMGISWVADESDIPKALAPLFVAGAGQHTLVGLLEGLPLGEVRIRVDAQNSRETTRVAVAHVKVKDAVMLSLRKTPGVKIVEAVNLPARSKRGKIQFELRQTSEEAYMDIAVTDANVKVSLEFPDGRSTTIETAETDRLSWSRNNWPNLEIGEDCGLGYVFALATMLPVEGQHQSILFPHGIPQNGRYVLHFDASGSARSSEASAMFIPRFEALFMP